MYRNLQKIVMITVSCSIPTSCCACNGRAAKHVCDDAWSEMTGKKCPCSSVGKSKRNKK